jgi:hypothetical protein
MSIWMRRYAFSLSSERTDPGILSYSHVNNNEEKGIRGNCESAPENRPRSLRSLILGYRLSEKRNNRRLFPTDELPTSSNLTLASSYAPDCGVGAMVSALA